MPNTKISNADLKSFIANNADDNQKRNLAWTNNLQGDSTDLNTLTVPQFTSLNNTLPILQSNAIAKTNYNQYIDDSENKSFLSLVAGTVLTIASLFFLNKDLKKPPKTYGDQG